MKVILKIFIFSCIFILLPVSISAEDEEDLKMTENLLRGNFIEAPFTALVKYKKIKIVSQLGGYISLEYNCEVKEVYKGENIKNISFLRTVDADLAEKVILRSTGKSAIVSLFYENDDNVFYMGDNGYEIPSEPHYIQIAQELKKSK